MDLEIQEYAQNCFPQNNNIQDSIYTWKYWRNQEQKQLKQWFNRYLPQHIVTLSRRLFWQVDLFFHHYIYYWKNLQEHLDHGCRKLYSAQLIFTLNHRSQENLRRNTSKHGLMKCIYYILVNKSMLLLVDRTLSESARTIHSWR